MTGIMLGAKAHVIHASDPSIIGLNGTILDETKNMLSIWTRRGIRYVPKLHTRLRLESSANMIQDSDMRGRFYERTVGP